MNSHPFIGLQVLIPFIFFFHPSASQTATDPSYTITVEIQHLQNDKGKVMLALFNSEKSFMKTRYMETIAPITKDLKATAVFKDVPAGTYAISVFQDENDNNELDSNRLRVPQEPYGFSNNARGTLGPASYSDASFKLDRDMTLNIEVK